MAQCRELSALDDIQADLTCVVCLEPLHEGRRFDCFHLLCSLCADKHVEACLHQSDRVMIPFGPVFCPQCRNVTYVFSEARFGLPECKAVMEARKESQRLLVHLEGLKKSVISDSVRLEKAAQEIEKNLSNVMTKVRNLITNECEIRDRIFEWANDEDLVDDSLICERNGDMKVQQALAALKEEFEEEVATLVIEREEITNLVEDLLLQKWVLEALRQCDSPNEKVEEEWEWWKDHRPEKMEEAERKEDLEVTDTITPEETFLLTAIFRLRRPYPGAVLPENRVKAGSINAELLWSVGQRGNGVDEFNWPIHAAFIGNGDQIAVADKNNARVVILNSSDGKPVNHLFKGIIKPRRVFSQGSNLFVSDEVSAMVKVFEMGTWKPVTKFGHGLFLCPTGVCEKKDQSLVYTDMDKGFLSVHDPESFALKTKFTARLLGDIYLPSPSYVAVDADNYFVVSDSQNNCIKIFNERGGIFSRFGSEVLRCPRGIAVDPLGLIFVVDSDNHAIRVFDPFGKLVQTLELPGPPLHYPMSLDFRPQERLLLVTQCSFLYHDHSVMLYRLDFTERAIKKVDDEDELMI